MLEVFTIGGGEYIVNIFNAVAAWTGSGGYASMIRVVMVMALIYVLLIVAFNQDWRAWMNWFIQSTLIYLCLMVPTVTVKVTDRINPGLAPSVVANVPLGLGIIASFTSQMGDYLTREAETVFVSPSQLQYSSNGIIYGSRLLEATRQIRITDPEFAANINEHMKRCVFYDVLLGFKSMDTLAKSTDLWTDLGPGSQARAQQFITRNGTGPGATTTTDFQTCRDAYNNLTPQWTAFINDLRPKFAKTLYPNLSNAAADAKLVTDLPVTNQAFTGNASAALEIMRQNLAMNAFMQARDDMAGGTGASSIDSFAATRADIQTRNTYSAIAQGAMKWVPVLNIVLTVVFYAMFPVIFPLFLFPRTGVDALKGYAVGFFYLAAWGPLYVVLHMILMDRGLAASNAMAAGGITLGNFAGIGAVNDETATLAGYMIAAVPFLAAGMARGAMAIASQATSFLGPSQNAAEQAAAEATTGNYAYGNASLANQTVNTQSRDQWSTAPNFSSGASAFVARQSNGAFTTTNADGSTVTNQQPAISHFESRPSFSTGQLSEIRATAGEFQSQATSHREASSQSISAANTIGSQMFDTAQRSRGNEFANGTAVQDSMSRVDTLSRNLSDRLQRELGWSKESADHESRSMMQTGEVSADARLAGGITLSKPGRGLGGIDPSVSLTGGGGGRLLGSGSHQDNKVASMSASERINRGIEMLRSEGLSASATSARESFYRASATSGDSQLVGLTHRRDASLTEARSQSLEAARLEEAGKRYSRDFSATDSQGFSASIDLSQAFQTFVSREIATNPAIRDSGYSPWMRETDVERGEYGPRAQAALSTLQARFGQSYVNNMRAELGSPQPLTMGSIANPGVSSAASVNAWGSRQIGDVNARGPHLSISDDFRDPAISSGVATRLSEGGGRMDAAGHEADAVRDGARAQGGALRGDVEGTLGSSLLSSVPLVSSVYGWVTGAKPQTSFQAAPFVQQQGVGVKPGVRLQGLSASMAPVISAVTTSSHNLGLGAPTISSALDGHHGLHGRRTLHPSGNALDFRANTMSPTMGERFASTIRGSLPRDYDVVWEPHPEKPNNRHVHVEYDPKSGKGR